MLIFFNPQSSAGRKPILPFSLLAVGAVLEGHYDYNIVDANLEDNPVQAIGDLIEQSDAPCVLGVTAMPGPQLQQAVPLCQTLKQKYPNLVIVWGGYFATQHWEACLRAEYVDYVVRGHGETVFLALLNTLHESDFRPKQETLKTLNGLAYRNSTGNPVSNDLAPLPHPAQLPAFNFDRLPMENYVRSTFLGNRTLGYHSSYGCPFFCNFCAVVNLVNGRWLPQTAAQVAEAAQLYHKRWGVNAIEFYDNNFFTAEKRVAEFSERVMDLNLAWWGEGRIDTMQKYAAKTWQLMRDSGLKMVFMGAESGSDETLKRMNKGGKMSVQKILEMAASMREWGIVPEFSFVMGNPPDPEADLVQTMDFIRKVKQVNPDVEVIMYLYTPVPLAGDLYDQAQASGFAFPQTLDEWVSPDWYNFSQRRSVTMPWIKQSLQQRIHDFERVLNAYYPTSTDTRLTGLRRSFLRGLAAWRYHSRFYRYPLELRAVHKLMAYQRPETSGF